MTGSRYTKAHLDSVVGLLNRRVGFPEGTPLWERIDGVSFATVGMYYLGQEHGGLRLYQMVNTGGGVRDVFASRLMTKREAYGMVWAYLEGMTDGFPGARNSPTELKKLAQKWEGQ